MSVKRKGKPKHNTPSLIQTGLEARWMLELASHHTLRPLLKKMPKGDGHSVIIYPGFMTSERSTRSLRRLFKDLGYDVHDWGMGRNLRYSDEIEDEMKSMVLRLAKESGRKVSLVGWSLGGVFAREIARDMPENVRCVISMGSPITGARHVAVARPIFEILNGLPKPTTRDRIDNMHVPPPVPCTAIYSKSDGIVHWHGALQGPGELAENVRVHSSHLGMGSNPLVMYTLADRLAQKEGEWTPFDIKGMRKLLYRKAGIRRRPIEGY